MSFAVHNLEKISSNHVEVHFEILVHLLRYVRYNKDLELNHYADMKDAPLSDLLIQANINNENQLMAFSDSSWWYFPDSGKITGSCIIFYQGSPIDYGTHFPLPVAKSIAESVYNAVFNEGSIQLADIDNNNVGDNDLTTRIKCIMVRIDKLDITLVQ